MGSYFGYLTSPKEKPKRRRAADTTPAKMTSLISSVYSTRHVGHTQRERPGANWFAAWIGGRLGVHLLGDPRELNQRAVHHDVGSADGSPPDSSHRSRLNHFSPESGYGGAAIISAVMSVTRFSSSTRRLSSKTSGHVQ